MGIVLVKAFYKHMLHKLGFLKKANQILMNITKNILKRNHQASCNLSLTGRLWMYNIRSLILYNGSL